MARTAFAGTKLKSLKKVADKKKIHTPLGTTSPVKSKKKGAFKHTSKKHHSK